MRRVLSIVLALLMVIGLCACGSNEAETQTDAEESSTRVLRVGMECAYAPNNWLESDATDSNVEIENADGYAEGYDVQIAKLIAAGMEDTEVTVVMLSWDGLIEALNQGQIDMIIAGMADTAARREAINFSDPYHLTEYGIMVKSDSEYVNATSINDFSGASVLGQKDTQLDTVIDQMEGVEHLTPVSSVPNMISRLQEGTCDAIVINLENADSYLAAYPEFTVIRFDEGNGFDLGFVGACVGIRKTDNELLEEVNAALAGISQETRDQLWEDAVANQPN